MAFSLCLRAWFAPLVRVEQRVDRRFVLLVSWLRQRLALLVPAEQISAIDKDVVVDPDTKNMLAALGFEDLPRVKVEEVDRA